VARGFTFRLETVLRVRRDAFEERQRIVAARVRVLQAEQGRAADLERWIDAALDESRHAQAAPHVDLEQVRGVRVYVYSLRQQLEQVNAAIQRQQDLLQKERAAMVEASVALKAIEKLKERRRARYLQDEQRRESAEEGELAIQAYLRRSQISHAATDENALMVPA
jgi:flagellar export protein FliJ